MELGIHWAIYDIPPEIRELAEHWPATRHTLPQATNAVDACRTAVALIGSAMHTSW